MIVRELRRIATAATFLTRLPWVARYASGDPVELGRSARWFPLIGMVVGSVGGLVYLLASAIWDSALAALIALAAMLLLTGAFHEDGWADTFDGLFGGWTPERRLEIMRDSRIGAYGAIALIMLLLGKWQALASVAARDAMVVLIGAHAAARWSTLALALALPYVRGTSAMKPVASGIGPPELAIGTGAAIAAIILVGLQFGPWFVALGITATLTLVVGAAGLFRARLGGITGDCLGAINQATELVWLLTAAAVVRA